MSYVLMVVCFIYSSIPYGVSGSRLMCLLCTHVLFYSIAALTNHQCTIRYYLN